MNNLATSALAHGKRTPKPTKPEPKSEPKAKAKGKVKVNEIHVRRAQGGFIAKHLPEPGPGKDFQDPDQAQESNEHILPDIEALKEHLATHFGPGGEPAAEAQEAQGSGNAE